MAQQICQRIGIAALHQITQAIDFSQILQNFGGILGRGSNAPIGCNGRNLVAQIVDHRVKKRGLRGWPGVKFGDRRQRMARGLRQGIDQQPPVQRA